jgi:hypothetical protein
MRLEFKLEFVTFQFLVFFTDSTLKIECVRERRGIV